MKEIQHKIDKNTYLYQIEPFKSNGIPRNSIFFKVIPGLGATTGELLFKKRNTIIIVPNLPVIRGKCKKYNGILGVHEGVGVSKIIKYITSNVKGKKILTTPESFYKVKKAFEQANINMYMEYFLMFDECEKIVQEIGFRSAIALPMDDFFKFEAKAFVSATPIYPSDPRFEEHGFKIHKIVPTFDYSQELQLLFTNNIFFTLRELLEKNPRDHYFIFLNSTDTILNIIKYTGRKRVSKVFSADKSYKKTALSGVEGSTELGVFLEENYFTGRFFSAVDIDKSTYKGNPSIVIVSDVISAPHSMIDPFSHAAQIQGRFRQDMGDENFKREIIHITNINPNIKSKTKEEVLAYLDASHEMYSVISELYNVASTEAARDVLDQALERIDYSRFVKANGRRNYDMVDNLVFEEGLKSYYNDKSRLINAYRECGYFKLPDDNIRSIYYSFDDLKRIKVETEKQEGIKSLNKIVEETLIDIYKRHSKGEATDFELQMEVAHLNVEFPEQMSFVNAIGLDRAKDAHFDIKKIEHQLLGQARSENHFAMIDFIRKHFKIGEIYKPEYLKSKVNEGMSKFGIEPKSSLQNVRKYLLLSDKPVRLKKQRGAKEEKGYKVLGFIF